MKVLYHPDFAKDVRKFEADYRAISEGLKARFRRRIGRRTGSHQSLATERRALSPNRIEGGT